MTLIPERELTGPDEALVHALPEIAEVQEYVDYDLIRSSRTNDDPALHELMWGDNTTPETQLARVEAIIDPEVIEATRSGGLIINSWLSPKLVIIADLLTEYPDQAFVFVDDGPEAAILRTDHPRLIGVNVAHEMQNTIMHVPALVAERVPVLA